MDAFMQRNNPIHILVNNTGKGSSAVLLLLKVMNFYRLLPIIYCVITLWPKLVLKAWKIRGYSRIINIISTSVKAPLPNLGVSNMIRAAVANWSKTMANELGKYNITVNNVLPVATNTQRLKTVITKKLLKSFRNKFGWEGNAAWNSNGRFAEASEIANAVAFWPHLGGSY